jgi:ATP-dependent exoDNAse (exonuclease V) alpha subunit
VQFNIREHPHLDYGYAVTSHSTQGLTADRVLVHVDTEQAHHDLINSRLGYVSISRAQYDAQIYTDNAEALGRELSKDVSKESALDLERDSDRSQDQESRDEDSHGPAESERAQAEREQEEQQSLEA